MKASAKSRNGVEAAIATGSGISIACGCYVVLHSEPAVLPQLTFISTWTIGLMVMLFVAGVAMGASMCSGGMLESFLSAHARGVDRVAPAALLGAIAGVSYWAAAVMYTIMGLSQNTFNPTASRVMLSSLGITLLLSICAALGGRIDPLEVLIWGGNLAYLGNLCGWMVADGLRD